MWDWCVAILAQVLPPLLALCSHFGYFSFFFVQLFKMQCPTCLREQLSKKYWRPSQWCNWTAVNPDFFQCKICDGEMVPPYWEPARAPAPARAPDPARAPRVRPMPSNPPEVPKEALDLIELLVHFKADIFRSLYTNGWSSLFEYDKRSATMVQ